MVSSRVKSKKSCELSTMSYESFISDLANCSTLASSSFISSFTLLPTETGAQWSRDADSKAFSLFFNACSTRFLLSLCSRFSSSSMEPGKNRFAGYFLNLRQSSSAMSEITCNAFSRSALLCAAEMQKRTRGSVIGVAGEPTTTTAKPRLKARREKSPILYG